MVEWLIGENCVGLLLAPDLRDKLLHQLLGPERPELEFQQGLVRLYQEHDYSNAAVLGQPGMRPCTNCCWIAAIRTFS